MKTIAKFIIMITLANFAFTGILSAEIDFNKKPAALEEKKYEFPKYEIKQLKNGLTVYVVEDHEQPTISVSLMIKSGSAEDGKKYGTAMLTSEMLLKGTSKFNAYEISGKIDGIGASISSNASVESSSIWGFCLKEHTDEMMKVFADAVLHPKFPSGELEKLVKNELADLQLSKSRGTVLTNKLSKWVIYGQNNPLATTPDENSLKSITTDDLEEYYDKWYLPNNASIAVIGDINPNDAVKLLDKYLGQWKKGKIPEIKISPVSSMPKGIYFIERPGSVQSSMYIASLAPGFKSPDYLPLSLATRVMGSSSMGRLFKTLREKYSFTYSPFSYLTESRNYNRAVCAAEVASAKTDSSIQVVFNELDDLANKGPDSTELAIIKDYTLGKFYMSLESSERLASLIQDYDLVGMAIGQIENYPVRIKTLTKLDVQIAADKYLRPSKSFVVITGDPEIENSLNKYGKVYKYNTDLQPAALEKSDIPAEEIFQKYYLAIGGDNLSRLVTLEIDADAEMTTKEQSFTGKSVKKYKLPGKMYMKLDLGPFIQESWVNGDSAWTSMNNSISEASGDELKYLKEQTKPFSDALLPQSGYKCTTTGKSGGKLIVKAISPEGKTYTLTFDENSFLLEKKESIIELGGSKIPITEYFGDYKNVSGMKLPAVESIQTSGYTIKQTNITYTPSVEIKDDTFNPGNK